MDVTTNPRDIYFLNIPERAGRRWEEFRNNGYLSTVGCARALDALSELTPGDVLAAYLRRCGYVGVGVVLASAQPVLSSKSEYVVPVRWLRAVDREDACWLRHRGLFASPQIKASLSERPETLRYLQHVFDVTLSERSRPQHDAPYSSQRKRQVATAKHTSAVPNSTAMGISA